MTKPKFDLGTLDLTTACNKPYKLELVHPMTKEPLGMYIYVLGRESDVFQSLINESINTDRRLAAMRAKQGKDPVLKTIEQDRQDSVELYAHATTAFEELNFNGPLSYTFDNAVKLYSERSWVLSQVSAAINDITNFM